MEIVIKAEPKEIAALVAAIQERQSIKIDSKSVAQAAGRKYLEDRL